MNELKDYQSLIVEKSRKAEEIFDKYPEQSKQFKEKFAEINVDKIEPEIMVYGICNAGKSSILNELMGKDLAAVNDIPETDRVTYYDWQGYRIADTPGISAPKIHQDVTQQHLRKADVVLFVMSTTGSNEKRENYVRMKEIADAGKKIIIVLNDKNGDLGKNDEAIRQIKQKVAVNMQQLGINDVDEKYHIVTVNAKRALLGRKKSKPALIERSGMDELKNVIINELKHTSSFDLLRRRVKQLEQVLDQFVHVLEGLQNSEDVRNINRVLDTLSREKVSIGRQINLCIDKEADRLANNLPQLVWSNRNKGDRVDSLIAGEIEQLNRRVQKEVEMQLADLASKIELEIKMFAGVKVESQGVNSDDVKTILSKLAEIDQEQTAAIIPMQQPSSTKSTAELAEAVATTGLAAGLIGAGTKEIAKNLMKTEVGQMIAGTALGKVLGSAIPVIGPVITVVGLLKTFLGDDGNEQARIESQIAQRNAQERQRIEAEMQARQELNQKCRYMADNIADTLKNSVGQSLGEVLGKYEEPFKAELAQRKSSEHEIADDTVRLRSLVGEYEQLLVELGER